MMNNANRIAAVLALAGAVLAAGSAPAQGETKGRKGRKARSAPTAKQLVEQRVRSLARRYRVTDAQQAKLARIAAVQIRDLEKLDRHNGARGKDLQRRIDPLQARFLGLKKQTEDLQNQLRALQDEMQKLEDSRKALLGKQAAEIGAVVTEQQRVVHGGGEFIRRYTRGLWDEIDDGKRRDVTRAAQDAARKIIRADPEKRREVERATVQELTDALVKIIGAPMARALRQEAINKAVGVYRRLDLTDEQKEKIHALTERFNIDRAKRQRKIDELEEQVKGLKLESTRTAPDALKRTVMEKILTPEQREKLKPKAPKDRT